MSNEQAPNHLFFGCWDESGHYLRTKHKKAVSSDEAERWGFLTPEDLDQSRLLLPRPQVEGQGCRTYLPALHLTVLSWWNQVLDTRPGVNSHFMMKGRAGDDMMWDTFHDHYPELAKLHFRPVLQTKYST